MHLGCMTAVGRVPMGIDMDKNFSVREFLQDIVFDVARNFMRRPKQKIVIQLQVERYKNAHARLMCPQIVETDHFGMRGDDRGDPFALGLRQFPVHQHIDRRHRDMQGGAA